MKPPAFWSSSGWRSSILVPVSWLASAVAKRRVAKQPDIRAQVPVICIGNINLGGTGKTPTAIALAQRLIARGYQPHFVSRGYGGKMKGPVRVEEQVHAAGDVGDEPLLLAAFAPTWVARVRQDGVRQAQDAGADVIILDDGHQNPSVAKDLSIVVVDAGYGFGNTRVFPAGPLRETIDAGLARADIVLSIGPYNDQSRFAAAMQVPKQMPLCKGHLQPLETGMQWQGLRALAFAGIGRPEKFFETLRGLGTDLVQRHALDDHQPYSGSLIKRLGQEAANLNAQLVTTEKDAARLPSAFRAQVLCLVVRLEIDDWGPIDAMLAQLGLGPPD